MAANRRLTGGTITNVLTSYRNNGAYGYGYAPYFGLSSTHRLAAIRFAVLLALVSPYGFGYQNNFGIPWYYYRPVSPLPNPGNNSGNNGFITNPPVAGVPVAPPGRRHPVDPDNPDPLEIAPFARCPSVKRRAVRSDSARLRRRNDGRRQQRGSQWRNERRFDGRRYIQRQ
jgi:hypothetical protein